MKRIKTKNASELFEGEIKPLAKTKAFYMVVVQGSIYPPGKQHETYDDAFNECLRLSKKENKTAFVMVSVTQVELIHNVTQFK